MKLCEPSVYKLDYLSCIAQFYKLRNHLRSACFFWKFLCRFNFLHEGLSFLSLVLSFVIFVLHSQHTLYWFIRMASWWNGWVVHVLISQIKSFVAVQWCLLTLWYLRGCYFLFSLGFLAYSEQVKLCGKFIIFDLLITKWSSIICFSGVIPSFKRFSSLLWKLNGMPIYTHWSVHYAVY